MGDSKKMEGKYATAILHFKAIEDEALKQIEDICNNPAMEGCNIAIMPDAHSGAGCVIGFTSTINDKIIPNLVGVDIGCGMAYTKFKLELEEGKNIDFKGLDEYIRENIPSGFDVRESCPLADKSTLNLDNLKCIDHISRERAENSVGTLGGGNHFIEIDKDDKGYYYLVIHSGSRYLGKQVCEYYQNLAYEKCKKDVKIEGKTREEMIEFLKSEGRETEIQDYKKKFHDLEDENPIDKDTAYLQGQDKDDYINDAMICKRYATMNRFYMAMKIMEFFGVSYEYLRETVHNYIGVDHIIRKGAILNYGESLIPINMRDGAFIVESKGKTGKERNNSLPHGAGRLMSRHKARETISMEEFEKSMEGIYSSCISESTLDESPMAYKSIDNIEDIIGEVCIIKEHIKPVYNFKAS